jgi:hypothetical protein
MTSEHRQSQKFKGYLSPDDEIVLAIGITYVPDEAAQLLHRHAENKDSRLASHYINTEDHPPGKGPYSMAPKRSMEVDITVCCAVFANEKFNLKYLRDDSRKYKASYDALNYHTGKLRDIDVDSLRRGTPHPEDPSYYCVGHTLRVAQEEKEVTFPFVITRTKAYFSADKTIRDVHKTVQRSGCRPQAFYETTHDLDDDEGVDEDTVEMDDNEYLLHETTERNCSKWLSDRLVPSVVI